VIVEWTIISARGHHGGRLQDLRTGEHVVGR
jgi:hypothetical protein